MLRDLFINFSIVVTLTSLGVYLVNLRTTVIPAWIRRIVIALFLSGCSILLMAFPIRLALGAMLDFRSVPILLAAFYRGPGWGLAVAVPVALFRFQLGGAGMPAGLLSIFGMPLVGALFTHGRYGFDRPVTKVVRYTALTCSIVLLDLLLVPGQDRFFFVSWYPVLVVSYTGAMTLCAHLLRTWSLAQAHLEEAESQALTDHLTGLPNVRAFEKDLNETPTGCLLLIDVDHFKQVNDTYGHPGGDLVLQAIGATIHRSVRTEDMVCRFGGEEFAVLLRGCMPADAAVIAERVRANVADQIYTLPDGDQVRMTISGGLSEIVPGALKDQFAAADKLLYRAKESGRNRICAA